MQPLTITIYQPVNNMAAIPFVGNIAAGFPSPALEHIQDPLNLVELITQHTDATFYGQVKGNSMIEAGYEDGDIIVIDRSVPHKNNKPAVCFVDGNFTIKKVKKKDGRCWLMPANKDFEPIEITEESNAMIWGMVTWVLKKAK